MSFKLFKLPSYNVIIGKEREIIDYLVNDNEFKAISYLNVNTFIELKETFTRVELSMFKFLVDGKYVDFVLNLFFGAENTQVMSFTYIYKSFFAECEKAAKSIYLVGGTDEVIKKTVDYLKDTFPNLIIAGYAPAWVENLREGASGMPDLTPVVNDISTKKPDFVVLSMGGKQHNQEKFVLKNIGMFRANTNAVFCVGGLFNRLAGKDLTIPRWVNSLGLEWLIRFLVKPGKIIRRIYEGLGFFKVFSEELNEFKNEQAGNK
ncbi:WecB/TagA/CpsF family glycosyltransferase [Candidatus Dojkabacteria bacterium]|nr:WecB/TagA/CpsF family glycosyltransferase [Candidatus Dojkabacteria bacterium]